MHSQLPRPFAPASTGRGNASVATVSRRDPGLHRACATTACKRPWTKSERAPPAVWRACDKPLLDGKTIAANPPAPATPIKSFRLASESMHISVDTAAQMKAGSVKRTTNKPIDMAVLPCLPRQIRRCRHHDFYNCICTSDHTVAAPTHARLERDAPGCVHKAAL